MSGPLAPFAITLSLVTAGWALLATARNRPPDRIQFGLLAALGALLLILAGTALVAWAGGTGPGEVGTFVGYLVTLVCLPPLAAVLARMEPTRWGSVIVLVVCLTIPVVVVWLQQTWQAVGG